jgi:hypothetical protein
MEILGFIAEVAERRGLGFLVIGGLAVNAHGYSRLTGDVDVLVRRAEVDAWVAALGEMGYVATNRTETFVQLAPPMAGLWPVDLMLVNDLTFAHLAAEACEAALPGARVRIPSVEHLCALKLHALKQTLPHRDQKDFTDLIHLIRFNRIDPNSSTFRRLVEKYGTTAIHERIQHALSGSEGPQSHAG